MSKKVTEKDTKAVIFQEMQRLQEELEARNKSVHDPVKVVQETKKKEIINNVEAIKPSAMETLYTKFQEELKKFEDVKEAVRLKQNELNELFGIEKSAFALSALEIANKQEIERVENELERLNNEYEQAEANKREELSNDIKEVQARIKAEKEAHKQEIERAIAEWEYNFAREKKEKEDTLDDNLKIKNKRFLEEVELKEKELKELEDDLSAREEKVDSLEEEIAKLKEEMQTVIEETKEKTAKKCKESFGFETRYIKKEYESELALLSSKNENLEARLQDEITKNNALSTKLDEAYNKLEALANKTVEGASNKSYISSLEGIAKGNNSTNK